MTIDPIEFIHKHTSFEEKDPNTCALITSDPLNVRLNFLYPFEAKFTRDDNNAEVDYTQVAHDIAEGGHEIWVPAHMPIMFLKKCEYNKEYSSLCFINNAEDGSAMLIEIPYYCNKHFFEQLYARENAIKEKCYNSASMVRCTDPELKGKHGFVQYIFGSFCLAVKYHELELIAMNPVYEGFMVRIPFSFYSTLNYYIEYMRGQVPKSSVMLSYADPVV